MADLATMLKMFEQLQTEKQNMLEKERNVDTLAIMAIGEIVDMHIEGDWNSLDIYAFDAYIEDHVHEFQGVKSQVDERMDHQNNKTGSDSGASGTRRVSFSTTDYVADIVENAAYERHISRSKLIEAAITQYLNL